MTKKIAPYFRIEEKEVTATINLIQQKVRQWEHLAVKLGISRSEMELMRDAFRY